MEFFIFPIPTFFFFLCVVFSGACFIGIDVALLDPSFRGGFLVYRCHLNAVSGLDGSLLGRASMSHGVLRMSSVMSVCSVGRRGEGLGSIWLACALALRVSVSVSVHGTYSVEHIVYIL